MESVPLSPIENSISRRRRRFAPGLIPFSSKAKRSSSNGEMITLSIQRKPRKEEKEKKENSNNKDATENISREITLRKNENNTEMSASELPNFSNLSPIKKKSKRDLHDHRDSSFQTQETIPLSDSDQSYDGVQSEEESCSTQDTARSRPSSPSCMSSKQNLGVRFADEIGLPIQSIVHYECDRNEREHSELVVLCICPEKKAFEFLHVGYYQESDASLKDLLAGLPSLCTSPVFSQSKFASLYCNRGLAFVNLCAPQSPAVENDTDSDTDCESIEQLPCSVCLQDCGFRENEVVVAAINGSSEREVLESIGPLLGNAKIRKTLKRARRSRRGLKFIGGTPHKEDKDSHYYHLQKRLNLSALRRNQKKQRGKENKETVVVVPKIDTDCPELVDEHCHDCDPRYDVDDYHKQLLLGILAIGSGTMIFSALGL